MTRRWTPQRFIKHRRLRLILCSAFIAIASIITFCAVSIKTVTLSYNGKISTIHTAAVSVQGMLKEKGIKTKTHDFITTKDGNLLHNGSVVTIRTAYQTTLTIDGKVVNFWTYATSADQILNFFRQNEKNAVKVSVDINNIYNKLTGGIIINSSGPVYLQADGKKIKVPKANTTAAAILDANSIQLGKNDRVNVIRSKSETILRVQRVSYTSSTKQVTLPYATVRVKDPTRMAGTEYVSQKGSKGLEEQTYRNLVVDGRTESTALVRQTVIRYAVNEVVMVGTKKKAEPVSKPTAPNTKSKKTSNKSKATPSSSPSSPVNTRPSPSTSSSSSSSASSSPSSTPSSSSSASSSPSSSASAQEEARKKQEAQNQKEAARREAARKEEARREEARRKAQAAALAKAQAQAEATARRKAAAAAAAAKAQQARAQQEASSTWHATPAQAQVYGQAAAAQYGWTGNQWQAVVWLFNRESNWRWNAANPSGAYGIPQALPGSKMASSGSDWHDNAATQINWGLGYISGRYGTPLKAKAYHLSHNWY